MVKLVNMLVLVQLLAHCCLIQVYLDCSLAMMDYNLSLMVNTSAMLVSKLFHPSLLVMCTTVMMD